MVEETRFNPVPLLAAILVRLEPSREEVEDTEPFLEERELGVFGDWYGDEAGDANVDRYTEGDGVFFFNLLWEEVDLADVAPFFTTTSFSSVSWVWFSMDALAAVPLTLTPLLRGTEVELELRLDFDPALLDPDPTRLREGVVPAFIFVVMGCEAAGVSDDFAIEEDLRDFVRSWALLPDSFLSTWVSIDKEKRVWLRSYKLIHQFKLIWPSLYNLQYWRELEVI
jgi:hypothetical protein